MELRGGWGAALLVIKCCVEVVSCFVLKTQRYSVHCHVRANPQLRSRDCDVCRFCLKKCLRMMNVSILIYFVLNPLRHCWWSNQNIHLCLWFHFVTFWMGIKLILFLFLFFWESFLDLQSLFSVLSHSACFFPTWWNWFQNLREALLFSPRTDFLLVSVHSWSYCTFWLQDL